jgi:microsomal dipeptidase-like Zn-dependent dipeptidase
MLVTCASAGALFTPAATADVYAYANGCYALRDTSTDRFVVRDALGYAATARTAGAATPFRLQATALGRYLLYGPDERMPGAGALDTLSPTAAPGPAADWRFAEEGGTLRLENVSTDRNLGVGALGRLVQVASSTPRWSLAPAEGCATFPEVEVNVTGQPFKGPNAKSKVRGFVDDHIHLGAFRFLSGGFHCGRPWSPYGVTVAMRDCADHYPNGEAAVVENFLANGSPNGTHSPEGWPSFEGWPRDESLTHEGTYWKWIERAWRSGLRIMVNDLVENRALCDLYPVKQDVNCNEMASAYEQAEDMHALQDYIDAQFGGPGKGFLQIVKTPAEARKVINAGKLAMVLGVEVSEVLDCGQFNDVPRCTPEQIDAELDKLRAIGVVSLFPVHKFDNALGGVKFDSGATGVLVNTGNKYATGKFWTAEHCDDPDHDNEPTNPTGEHAETFATLFGPVLTQPLFAGQLPVYPPAPLCNPKGLTALGEHLIRAMMRRGMIIETDHMSMRARRQTLDLLEGNDGYPGVISSHSWGDPGSQRRIQGLGGLIGPISDEANGFAEEWREARANRDPRFFFGLGFGSDINGLHAQPKPRAGAAANPVRYPFRSFDGGSVIDRQRSGTRTWDINTDGVDHYGLYADWVEDMRLVAGQQIVDDLANGAEAYLQLWERAEKAAGD